MSILIGKYEFDGPFNDPVHLEEKQGLYAVLHHKDEEYELIHVAHADNIKERIELSQSAFTSTASSVLLAACYTPQSGARERSKMVEDIQSEFD
jgi:hypothetical protein